MGIDRARYQAIKRWFFRYLKDDAYAQTDSFANIALKVTHSICVKREIEALARCIGLAGREILVAKTIGLLHDVGRFQQYIRYGTFIDSISVDHGELGARIIREKGALDNIAKGLQTLIEWAVRNHNRAELPENGDPASLLYSRLLRDADKLDIYKVIISHYQNPVESKNSIIEEGFSNSKEISPAVAAAIQKRSIVDIGQVRNHNDLMLLRMGWVFDVNFKPTLRQIKKRGYIEELYHLLPGTDMVVSAYNAIREYIEKETGENKHEIETPAGSDHMLVNRRKKRKNL